MGDLLTRIKGCTGTEDCFGKVGGVINPIVFSRKRQTVVVMVITEQPRGEHLKKEDLKTALQSVRKNSLPQRLRALLGEKFVDSVVEEDGTFYWTHFAKCPGNFRHHRKGLKVNACADIHLLEEIKITKPSLLISVGGQCSQWLLSRAGLNDDWRDCVLGELCTGRIRELEIRSEESLKLRTIFLIHPAERSGLGWHIDKKLRNLIESEISALLP